MMFEKEFLNGCEVDSITVIDDERDIVEADVTVHGDYPCKAEDEKDGIKLMLNVLLCPPEYYADIAYTDANTGNLLNYEVITDRNEYDNLLSFVTGYAAAWMDDESLAVLTGKSV